MKKKILFVLIFALFFIIFLNFSNVQAASFTDISEDRVVTDFNSCVNDLNNEDYTQNYLILWHENSNSLCIFFLSDDCLSTGYYNNGVRCWHGKAKMYQYYNYNIDSNNREFFDLIVENNYRWW